MSVLQARVDWFAVVVIMLLQQYTFRQCQCSPTPLLILAIATHFPSAHPAENSRIHPDAAGVSCHEIRTNLAGNFYLPSRTERVPGLILLGGSDGAAMPDRSALLAAHGYAVLNLFYFGYGSLPKELAKVPVEYLTNAVSWLQARDQVDPARIGVIGHSRGAEAALLMATLCLDVRAVVGVAPSSVVWPGPGVSGSFQSAWSLQGKELPYVPVKFSKGVGAFLKEVTGGTQIEHRPLFEDALKNKQAVEKARIPVEKIKGAVLLISGEDDGVWPSSLMAEMIVVELRCHRHPFTYRHLSYKDAGHSFGLPFSPREDRPIEVFKMGGKPAGNAAAAAESWQALLNFLEAELRPGPVGK
jgi:dienelactone hydrolase